MKLKTLKEEVEFKEAKTPIDIGHNTYRRNHGKNPSPSARGWAFDIIDASSNKIVDTVFAPGNLNLADAKTWIKTHVRNEYPAELATGYLDVEVAP